MSDTFDLLEAVHDHETFVAFAMALATERRSAAKIEADNPHRYVLAGAHGWANGDIPAFSEAACEFFASVPDGEPVPEPSWKVFAEILWCGKIIE